MNNLPNGLTSWEEMFPGKIYKNKVWKVIEKVSGRLPNKREIIDIPEKLRRKLGNQLRRENGGKTLRREAEQIQF